MCLVEKRVDDGGRPEERWMQAQQLFWEISYLRMRGVPTKVFLSLVTRVARLHEERASDLLSRQDADGWIDLFAAVTAWGEAGSVHSARDLLRYGEAIANRFDGAGSLLFELENLDDWLKKRGTKEREP